MKRKLLSVLLTFCLAFSLLPTAALAAEPTDPVAKIGDTTYATLKAAIDAVPSNGGTPTTITVLRNVTDAVGMTVPSGKNFIVDFGGYTYTVNKPGAGSKNTESQAFQLLKDSTIVFKNGTLRVAEDNLVPSPIADSSPVKYTNIRRLIQCYADLTLEDMTIDGTNQYGGASYVMSFNNQPVKLTGKTSVIAAEGKVAFDVDGNWGNPIKYNRCEVTINTTGTIVGNIEVGQGKLDMQNANVKGGIVLCTSCGAEETTGQKERITVTGGTFTGDVSAYLSDNYIQNNGKVEALGATNAVAQIGDTYYKTLADAVAAAPTDGTETTITLLNNVVFTGHININDGKNIILDLNGHDIVSTDAEVFDVYHSKFHVTGSGSINEAVKDGYAPIIARGSGTDTAAYTVITIDKDVTLKGDYSGIFVAMDDASSYKNYGLVINMYGSIELAKDGVSGYAIYINGMNQVMDGNVTTFNLTGAQISGDAGCGIYAAGYAVWKLKDTTITGENALSLKAGNFIIDGGAYKSTG